MIIIGVDPDIETKKEKQRQYVREWQKKNRERVSEYQRAYYGRNPDKYKAKYKKSNAIFKQCIEKRVFFSAKSRAKKYNIPFTITLKDIVIPEKCPVLNIPLFVGNGCCIYNSPSLDRIIPEKGYIPENIVVISHKANTIKNGATIEELQSVYEFYKKLLEEHNDYSGA